MVLHPGLLADHKRLQYTVKVEVFVHKPGLAGDKFVEVVHSPGLAGDRAVAAGEEVIPQVVEAGPHMAPFARKPSSDRVEMDRIHLAAEQVVQHMVLRIEGNVLGPELLPLRNYDRFDTGYS